MDKLIEELESMLVYIAKELEKNLSLSESRKRLIEILIYEINFLIGTEEDPKEKQKLRLLASSITVEMLKQDLTDRKNSGDLSQDKKDLMTNIFQMIRYLS